ncbi:MAG: hypothetical protein IPK27_19830 [Rhodanobacteraceae bacterium]|nr:hypothetical protein [Rhodanobacteraceae bacterium]
MRVWWLWLASICLPVLAATPPAPRPISRPGIAGIVTDPALGELSGLAPSRRKAERYWAINDGGNGNHLLLIDTRGRVQRKLTLAGVKNIDWEDLASFRWKGESWLLIADTGDNSGLRKYVSLWLLREPDPEGSETTASPSREIRLRYPDEPHDVESMTVDGANGTVYLLSKRTVPPTLYSLPLDAAEHAGVRTATLVAKLDGIPQPTEREIARDGSLSRFRSQATALELDCSGQGLLVLTYDAVYRFRRDAGQDWSVALPGQEPARSSITLLPQAEAMALDDQCHELLIGSEKAPVPLLRFRYRPLPQPAVGDGD